ncbi:MAG TPA: hypothetical protein VKY89_02250 [Thermoanaerobaculia bacterium]|nr:hypothetical protein [Thermoanaerobaculia bacterium]
MPPLPEAAGGAAPPTGGPWSPIAPSSPIAPIAPIAPIPPTPFGMLLDEAVPWTRRHLRTIYPPIALLMAIATAGVAAAQARWQIPMNAVDPRQSLVRLYAVLGATVPFVLVVGLLHGAMTVAAVDAVAGRAVDVRRALRFMVRPGVLGGLMLALLCILGSWLCCCFLPALYVWPLLGMTLPAMAAEGVTGMAALRRSAQLTRHNPRRRFLTSPIVKILALSLTVGVLSYLASLVLQLPLQVLQGLVFLRRAASGEDLPAWLSGAAWLQVPLSFLAALVTSAVALYSSFATALLFFDLRARREGDDLRQAIAGMTGAGPEPPAAPQDPR